MSTARIDQLIWVSIFGGLIVTGVGLSVARSDDTLGWAFIASGAVLVLIGAALVWLRSRWKGEGGR